MQGPRRIALLASFSITAGVVPVVVSVAPVSAETITVTTTADVVDAGDGLISLREAVDQANAQSGDDEIVLADDGVYELTQCDDVSMHVSGPGGLVLDGNGSTIQPGCGKPPSAGFIFVAGGGAQFDLVDVTLTGAGAGLSYDGDAAVSLTGVVVAGNEYGVNGEGFLTSHPLTLTDSRIDGNLEHGIDGLGADLTLVRSSVSENGREGIFEIDGVVTMVDSEASRNGGSGVVTAHGLDMLRSHIDDNGNGILVIQPPTCCPSTPVATVRDSTIERNQREGLVVSNGDTFVQRSVISSNAVGGIVATNGYGGESGSVIVEDSTIAGNGHDPRLAQPEGGVRVEEDDLLLTNSTVTGNRGSRGGVWVGGEADIRASTIAGNVGTVVDDVDVRELVLSQSIIGSGGGGHRNCRWSDSLVLLDVSMDVDGSCSEAPSWGLIEEHPRLRPLGDYGGPTLTRPPEPGSPAVDAAGTSTGGCAGLDTDQRGLPRPMGPRCDLGAVELSATFADVGVTHPFFDEIECLAELDVTQGYADGTFRPGLSITRQAVVAWLWRLAGEPAPAGAPPFSDVSPSDPFADAIAWAAEEGIVQGFPDGTFRPGAKVQRQALAAWLWRQAGEPSPEDGPPFSDVGLSHPFADAIAWLAEVGITGGYADGTFRPASSITRQAVAAWVCRADELVS